MTTINEAIVALSGIADSLAIDSFHETFSLPESSDAKLEACNRIREALHAINPEWMLVLAERARLQRTDEGRAA